MAFSPPECCRLFAQKKAYQGGARAPPDPPSYTPELSKKVPIILEYSGTLLYGHSLNTDPRIKQTVLFVLMKSSYIFSKHRLIRTMDTGTILCPETQTVIHCQPHVTCTGYLCTVCLNFPITITCH